MYKKTLESDKKQCFANHSAVVVVAFLNYKVFCQYLLRTPRFLLPSLKLVEVFYISVIIYYTHRGEHDLG